MKAGYRTILPCCFCAAIAWSQDTIARPMTERQRKQQEQRLRQELKSGYRKWPDQDVAYIITAAEKSAFDGLHTYEDREQFIEQYWLRRDPTPDTAENEFKEEHYRRIAYANEHFASGVPGWKTDRGRIYITFGPPDEIEAHPSGGSYQRTPSEGGGTTSTFPFERWRYRYLADIGSDIGIEFVDASGSGEYRMTIDPNEKDALQHVAGHGAPQLPDLASNNQFNRLEIQSKLLKPPRMPEILEVVHSVFRSNLLPLRVEADCFPLTEASVLVYFSIQFENKDLQFQARDGVMKASVALAGGIATVTRRNVASFNEFVTVDTPATMLPATVQRKSLYSKSLILTPGVYRFRVVAKDMIAGSIGEYDMALEIPKEDPEAVQHSSIVLADLIERVPTRSAGAGQFVVGDFKVRPRVDAVFHRDEKLGVFFKLYNFTTGRVEYEVIDNANNSKVLERVHDLVEPTGREFFDLADLTPGEYTLRIKVANLTRSVPFQVQ